MPPQKPVDPWGVASVQPSPAVDPWGVASVQPSAPSAPEPTQTGFFKGIQDSFDKNTQTSPKEPLLETGLKSVVGTIGAPFVHPIKTAEGILDAIPDSPDYPAVPLSANGKTYLRPEGKSPVVERGIQAYNDAKDGGIGYSATKLGGELLGAEALGGAIKGGAGAARNVGDNLSTLRDAAIGDPDAAALRGLRVGPGSPKALRTVSAVQGGLPFLQGANSLEDLQSRVPATKDQIWAPYSDAINRVGDKQTPLGTVRDLEKRRLEVSAQLRGLKTGDPQAIALAQQKGLTQADLLDEERNIKANLDPELQAAGIDPVAIRKSFGDVSTIGSRISGKSTLAEKSQPYGFGKLKDISFSKPFSNGPLLFDAGRDIVAGRPLFSGKPTDVAIKEAFRNGGPKPNFLNPVSAPEPRGYLESSTIGEPGGEDFTKPSLFSPSTPSRPSVITPPPRSFPALPPEVSGGQVQPMIGVKASPYPALADDFARTRVSNPLFAKPSQPMNPLFYAGEDGAVVPNRRALPAPEVISPKKKTK